MIYYINNKGLLDWVDDLGQDIIDNKVYEIGVDGHTSEVIEELLVKTIYIKDKAYKIAVLRQAEVSILSGWL